MRLELEDWKNRRRRAVFKKYPHVHDAVDRFARFTGAAAFFPRQSGEPVDSGMPAYDEMMWILDTLIDAGILDLGNAEDEQSTNATNDQNDRSVADLFNRFMQDREFFTHCYSLMNLAVKSNYPYDHLHYLNQHAQLQAEDQHYLYLILLALDNQSLLTSEVFKDGFYSLALFFREFLQDIFHAFAGKSLFAFVSIIQFSWDANLMQFFSKALSIYKEMGLFSSDDVMSYFERLYSILATNNDRAISKGLLDWKNEIERLHRIVMLGFPIALLRLYPFGSDDKECSAILEKISERNSFILCKLINDDFCASTSIEDFHIFFTEENLVQLDLLCGYAIELNILEDEDFENRYLQLLMNMMANPNIEQSALKDFCERMENFSLFFPADSAGNAKARFLAQNREYVCDCCMYIDVSIYDLIRNDLVSEGSSYLFGLTKEGAKFLGYMNRYNRSLEDFGRIDFLDVLWKLSRDEINDVNELGLIILCNAQCDENAAERMSVDIFNTYFPLLSSNESNVFFIRCLKELTLNVHQFNTPTSSASFFQAPVTTSEAASSNVETQSQLPVSHGLSA